MGFQVAKERLFETFKEEYLSVSHQNEIIARKSSPLARKIFPWYFFIKGFGSNWVAKQRICSILLWNVVWLSSIPGMHFFSWLPIFVCRMYDVDGNGVIDQDEMTKIIQVWQHFAGSCNILNFNCRPSTICWDRGLRNQQKPRRREQNKSFSGNLCVRDKNISWILFLEWMKTTMELWQRKNFSKDVYKTMNFQKCWPRIVLANLPSQIYSSQFSLN